MRVAQNGHAVAPDTVKDRYYRSLNQLKFAIKNSDDAYFWDNSGAASMLIAKIKNGSEVEIIDTSKVPNWFAKNIQ